MVKALAGRLTPLIATENASATAVPVMSLRFLSKPMVMASGVAAPSVLNNPAVPVTEGMRSSGSSGAPSVLIAVMKD